jgi:3-oxoacyl-(acyl-carrier-protein) synthase
MGMLSPLGTDVPSTWQGILAGRSGIGLIEHTDLSAYSTRFGGSVKGFKVEEYLSVKKPASSTCSFSTAWQPVFRRYAMPAWKSPMPTVSASAWPWARVLAV